MRERRKTKCGRGSSNDRRAGSRETSRATAASIVCSMDPIDCFTWMMLALCGPDFPTQRTTNSSSEADGPSRRIQPTVSRLTPTCFRLTSPPNLSIVNSRSETGQVSSCNYTTINTASVMPVLIIPVILLVQLLLFLLLIAMLAHFMEDGCNGVEESRCKISIHHSSSHNQEL